MWTLGPLGFTAPLALLALVALPLIWLVVRAIPLRPQDLVFPPTEILRAVPKTDETPVKAPPWLAIFRAITISLLLLGLAGPVLNPPRTIDPRPVLIVIDNGWTAAPIWNQMIEEAGDAARNASGQVRVILTAPQDANQTSTDVLSPARAAARIAATLPQPLLSDHLETARFVARLPKGQRILWFSDNVGRPGTADLAGVLARTGSVKLRVIASPAVAITRAEATSAGFSLGLVAATGALPNSQLDAVNARARVLASNEVDVTANGVSLAIEPALTRDVAALRMGDARSAGGVFLLDAFDRRIRTGLVAARQDDQPLLSDAHYLEEALSPYAEITRGEIERLATSGLDAILLPDAGVLPPREESALRQFVERGGMLIRFAGPRLIAAEPSVLLPAPVMTEARALRGALAWDNAGSLGGFDRNGPFAGLTIPPDARINQIAILAPKAQGDVTTPSPQVWARLNDGTPVVSAAPLGRGWRILFHSTAGPAWSDVAFSGLQVSMLRRVLARAGSSTIPAKAIAPTAPLRATLVLDGYGNLRAPSAGDLSIAPQNVGNAKADARHPPGIYEGGGSRLILQAAGADTFLPALPILPGIERVGRVQDGTTNLGPAFLAIGMMLCVADAVLALVFAGLVVLPRGLRFPAKALPLILIIFGCALSLAPHNAQAQTPPSKQTKATPSDLSLAYIRTGDGATDTRARAGLEGLSRILAARTSVEPGAVVGVDPASSDLALFPILYWLLPDRPIEKTPEAARALDRYMKTGGVVFVDSRGAGREQGAARAIARAALRGIEAPPLEQVPEGHVLGKAFYILRGFPGRYQNAKLWVETSASAAASANDGVSPLIVGDGDWASAWATATPVLRFGEVSPAQRSQEIAARVGVNVVLYALTGNYKADQVHIETLLNRLTPR
jgi:Domain of unknown function (DUF4159)/Aerotolerance regulator N-terminal